MQGEHVTLERPLVRELGVELGLHHRDVVTLHGVAAVGTLVMPVDEPPSSVQEP